MVSLKTKIFLSFIVLGLPIIGWAQSFTYSYIDPCTHEIKYINANMSAPIMVAYYGQVQAFTYTQLSDGTFDTWINNVYNKYKSTSPCQGVITTTTTTTSTNQVSNIISNVTSLVSLDLSSVTSGVSGGVGNNIGGTASSGSGSISSENKKDNDNNSNNNDNSSTSGSGNSGSSNSSGNNQGGESKGNEGGNSSGNQGGSNGGGNVDGKGNSSSGSGSSSSSSSGSGGKTDSKGETPKEEKPSEQKIENQKTETQKSQTQSTAKSVAKAKTETQKPAILLTGDIVGIQTKSNGNQDARATMSFTRVKGDGTASLGFSADYMVNAKIGNFSGIRSWIGTKTNGNKHINIVSGGLGLMPQSTSGNLLFVRVNSIKKFTALYGAAGTYGRLYKEELISTIAILGIMYKGQITKSLDATIIAAGIYSPYQKYYTESLFKAKPIVIPFLNINYGLTKTFKIGLTAGGTYVAGQDILNYQILMGAKLKL